MAQTTRIGRTATTVAGDGQYTVVTYHSTQVIKWNQSEIVLNSGGWHTSTTRSRINQASNQFRLGVKLFQKDFGWYVKTKAGQFDFSDNMTINRITGELIAN